MVIRWCLLLPLVLWPVLSHAQYTIRTVEVPFAGARGPEVTGTLLGDIVGVYLDARGQPQGFLAFCGGPVAPLIHLVPKAQSAAGIVGWSTAPTGNTTGFLLQDGTFTALRVPLSLPRPVLSMFSEALHVSSTGLTVGTYMAPDGSLHGFRYDPSSQTYTTIDVPDAQTTALIYIAEDGRILAKAVMADNSVTYWLWDNGTFTALALPDLPNFQVVARTAAGRLIGNTPEGVFLFDGTTVETFSVPDARLTQLFSVQDDILLGRYIDAGGVQHGFVAFPAGVPDDCDDVSRKGERDKTHRRHR